jgi:hypothetical protein
MADSAGPDSAAEIRKGPGKLPAPRAGMQEISRFMVLGVSNSAVPRIQQNKPALHSPIKRRTWRKIIN